MIDFIPIALGTDGTGSLVFHINLNRHLVRLIAWLK